MAGILNFSQFIGGPDNVVLQAIFPSTQKTFTYNFNQNITGWTFSANQQTIVVDTVSFDRNSGLPNFTTSKVIGSFPEAAINSSQIVVTNAATGIVTFTIPANLYTGPIVPDARLNVPLTVVDFMWSTGSGATNSKDSHRYALIQNWEPGVVAGNPTASTNPAYTAFGF
jgi:hypothetical protein